MLVHLPIFAERAENATITDVDGNVFVDFAGGVGVANAGHAHPAVVDAVAEQAARFLHTDYTVVPYETFVELAERRCALAPIEGETRAAFFNAGTKRARPDRVKTQSDLPAPNQEPQEKKKWVEPVAALLMALATLSTAWCGYQSAAWTRQSNRLMNEFNTL